jgi:hypothetical protein
MSLLAVAALNAGVNAQNTATIVMLDAVGGTATPSGTTTYPSGTQVTLTATSTDTGFAFVNWVISDNSGSTSVSDNPTTITVTGGNTYAVQPVFAPVVPIGNASIPLNYSTAAIVVVLASAGGTTNPNAGTYALANASFLDLKANANSGYRFSHWVISGSDVSTGHGSIPTNLTPTDNPYRVDHGYGNTYYYQAVFEPTSSPGPSPTVPEISGLAAIGVIAALGLVVVGTVAYKRKVK